MSVSVLCARVCACLSLCGVLRARVCACQSALCCVHACALTALLCVLSDQDAEEESVDVDISVGRFVRYQFTPAFLRLRTVGAT